MLQIKTRNNDNWELKWCEFNDGVLKFAPSEHSPEKDFVVISMDNVIKLREDVSV